MKKIALALVALILLPVAVLAADDDGPKIYEDAVLGIRYYDVADVRKYKGEDAQLLKLSDSLKRAKISDGVLLLNRIENITDNKYGMSAQYAVVVLLGKKKIRSHSDVEAFTKSAKAGEGYDLQYHHFDSVGHGTYWNALQSNKFTIKK